MKSNDYMVSRYARSTRMFFVRFFYSRCHRHEGIDETYTHTKDAIIIVVVVVVVVVDVSFSSSLFFTLLLVFFPLLSLSRAFLFYICVVFLVVLTSEHHNPMSLSLSFDERAVK